MNFRPPLALSLCQVAADLERRELSFGQFMVAMIEDVPPVIFEIEDPRGSLSRFWVYTTDYHHYLNKALAPLCTVPSLRGVVEWLERKEEEGNKRFYHHPNLDQLPLDGVLLLACYVEILCRLLAENAEFLPDREIPSGK